MNTWMRSGSSGPAHWVKLNGSSTYTVACQVVISKVLAQRVETQRYALAQRPGAYYHAPAEGEICQVCLEKAKAQV